MKKFLIIALILVGGKFLFAQNDPVKGNINSNNQKLSANEILDKIEEGILNANVSLISPYFPPEIYLNLLNGVSGYYSSNQAYYVLEDFFKEYRVIGFNYSKVNLNTLTPTATGSYYYEQNGIRSEAKIYLTIKLTGKSWQITQIAIN